MAATTSALCGQPFIPAIFPARPNPATQPSPECGFFSGRAIAGFNGADQESNLINDAPMIATFQETSLGDNVTVYFVGGGTGIDLVGLPAATYAITQ